MSVRFVTVAVTVLLFLLSCGGDPESALSTVFLSVTADQTEVLADTALWKDTNNDNTCDTYSVTPTSITLTAKVTKSFSLPEGVQPSPVRIYQADIIYRPQNTQTPAIPNKYKSLTVYIEPGDSQDIPLELVSKSQKEYFISTFNLLRTNPDLPTFEYYVIIRLHGEEIYTGSRTALEVRLNLQVSDFVSGEETCNINI
ncbi:MAG: hypothetical protein Q9N26_08915 [Aquificota bacterium]|nr:hypothetical protein [Aquificota bacterium]